MNPILEILIGALVVALIAITIKMFLVLTDLQKTIATTRTDLDMTMKRVDKVLDTTETLLHDEITPTIKIARETLANIEVTTRAIADTTVAARHVVTRVEGVVDPAHLATVGTALATFMAKRTAGAASGMLSGLFAGITHGIKLVTERRKAKHNIIEMDRSAAKKTPKLPPSNTKNGLLDDNHETSSNSASVKRR